MILHKIGWRKYIIEIYGVINSSQGDLEKTLKLLFPKYKFLVVIYIT